MGTSASHRSPATAAWERVRALYTHRDPDPGEVVGAIVEALDDDTRQAMSGPGVAVCLDALLTGSKEVSEKGLPAYLEDCGVADGGPATLSLAAGLRSTAEERIVAASAASRFAEIALDALAVTGMEAASGAETSGILHLDAGAVEKSFGGYAVDGRLGELTRTFLGYDLDRVFRYFVARDISDFVGTESFPQVGAAQRLLDSVGGFCRDRTRELDLGQHEGGLTEAMGTPPEARLGRMRSFLSGALGGSMDLLGAGGPR